MTRESFPFQRSPRCHFLGNTLRVFPFSSSSEQNPSLPGNATPLLIVAYVSFSARMVSLQFHCASVQNTALSKPIYVFVAVAVPIWSFISLSNHSLSLPFLFPTWQFFSLSSLRNSKPVLCTSALFALGCSDSIQSFPSYSVALLCLAFPCHRVSPRLPACTRNALPSRIYPCFSVSSHCSTSRFFAFA